MRFEMSFGALCGALSLWAIALRVLLIPVPPHDFWWHMAQGRAIAAWGRVPLVDSFSWTRAGAPFFDQSWLAQWLFFQLHALGGVPLLILVQSLLVLLAYAIAWSLARERAGGGQSNPEAREQAREFGARVAALILLGVIVVSFDNWLLRPQTYILPLFALWLLSLEAWRRHLVRPQVLVAAQVALMILWVNSHGSFPLALLLNAATLAGAWLDRKVGNASEASARPLDLRILGVASVAALLAVLVNPRGLQVLGYVRRMLSDPSNRFSSEWLSPTPRTASDAIFFAFALAAFLAMAHARRRPSWADSARMAVFFWLAITSGRYILWFALVAALPLASALAASDSRDPGPPASAGSRRMNALVAAMMWLLLLPLLPWLKPSLGLGAPLGVLLSPETPVRAARVLARNPPRRLWNNAPCGSYLAWAAPDVRVWIDTRFELYPPQQWRDYAGAAGGDGRVLERYGCDAALTDHVAEPDLERDLSRLGWERVYGPGDGDARFSVWRRPGRSS